MPRGPTRLAGPMLAAFTLLIVSAACFARLLADPTSLIVDPRRPSVDYANRGDPRPIGNDLVFLFLPHHRSIADRIARFGHRPTWDARGFGGRPMAGNPQAGMAYPPAWIAWRSRMPSALGWLTVAHLVWGGFGTYILLRSMGSGRWAATVAAGVYQASPYLLAHTFEGHYPHVWSACWYPWAFWAYRRLREGRTRGLLLAPVLALTYLTGHPQEWLLLALALSAWALVDSLRSWREIGPRPGVYRLAGWIGLVTISVGMAAVDAAPQAFARPWLRRNHDPHLDGLARRYHLGGLNAFQLLSPTALGGPADYFGDDNYWESVLSIGLVPMVLAIVAASRHPDRRLVRGWLGLTALAIVYAGGRALGLYPLCMAVVPGASLIRVAARSLFLANLAGAVLAGLGVETLRSRIAGVAAWRRLSVRLGILAAVLVASLLVVRRSVPSAPVRSPARIAFDVPVPPSPPASGRTARAASRVLGDPRFWAAMGGMAILVLIGSRPIGVRRRRAIAGLIGLLAMGELCWYGFDLIRVAPAGDFVGPDPAGAALVRLSSTGARPSVRIKARDAFFGDLPAAFDGIEKTNIDDAFQIDHAAILYETLYPIASHVRPMAERRLSPAAKDAWRRIRQAVLDRMSVGFLVSDRTETDPAWPVAAEGTRGGSRFVIQRNTSAMPRAYVVPRAIVLPDNPGVILPAMVGLDPRRSVVMTDDPLGNLAAGPHQDFTPAGWISVDPDRPVLEVATRAPGLLVVADTWMPGWGATVDGRPAPVLRGNLAQRVIPLPEAGHHVIAMRYRPPGLALGCVVSLASGAIWLGLIVGQGVRRARSRPVLNWAIRGIHRRTGARIPRIPGVRHPICRDLGA